jgi:hypothetical protein
VQFWYTDGKGPLRGWTTSRDATPDYVISLQPGERISGAFGRMSERLEAIGFWTSAGRQYGPYGGTGGGSFAFNGPVYAMFGFSIWNYQSFTGIGFWTDVPPPPPRLPASASPPPSPPVTGPSPPARLPPPNLGRIESALYGQVGDGAFWNDGATYSGEMTI